MCWGCFASITSGNQGAMKDSRRYKNSCKNGKMSCSCLVKSLLHLGGFVSSYTSLSEPVPQSGSMSPCLLLYLAPDLPLSLIILSLRNFMFLYCVCWHLSINRVPYDFYEMSFPKIYLQQKIRSGYLSLRGCQLLPGHGLSSPLGCRPRCCPVPNLLRDFFPLQMSLLCPSPSTISQCSKSSCIFGVAPQPVPGLSLIPLPQDFPGIEPKKALPPVSTCGEKKASFALRSPGQASRIRV